MMHDGAGLRQKFTDTAKKLLVNFYILKGL